MLFFIVLIIFIFIVGTILVKLSPAFRDFVDCFGFLAIVFALYMLGLLGYKFLSEECSTRIEFEQSEKVYSIGSAAGVAGDFTLGTGKINSQLNYYFFVEKENGYKVAKSINAENTLIKNTDDQEPRLITHHYRIDHPKWVSALLWPIANDTAEPRIDSQKQSLLIVPSKAIVQKYQVN